MADLMVTREGRMTGVQVVGVEANPHTLHIVVDYVAESGAWFDPSSPASDPDGWVRGVSKITGELELLPATRDSFDEMLATAQAFEREALCDLEGIASFNHQAVVLMHRPTKRSLAVKMPAEMLGN
jgi:hypothetical protein